MLKNIDEIEKRFANKNILYKKYEIANGYNLKFENGVILQCFTNGTICFSGKKDINFITKIQNILVENKLKCWYCNKPIKVINKEHIGVCDKCYDTMFKEGEVFIKMFQNWKKDMEKEKEVLKDQLKLIINRIDLLTQGKDYRFLNDNGTWYSRESCKDLSFNDMFCEIDKELNSIETNLEQLENAVIPKFKIGQEVYIIESKKVYKGEISTITISKQDDRLLYRIDIERFPKVKTYTFYAENFENEIFATKEEAENELLNKK